MTAAVRSTINGRRCSSV